MTLSEKNSEVKQVSPEMTVSEKKSEEMFEEYSEIERSK